MSVEQQPLQTSTWTTRRKVVVASGVAVLVIVIAAVVTTQFGGGSSGLTTRNAPLSTQDGNSASAALFPTGSKQGGGADQGSPEETVGEVFDDYDCELCLFFSSLSQLRQFAAT
jgi:hypothetical protein